MFLEQLLRLQEVMVVRIAALVIAKVLVNAAAKELKVGDPKQRDTFMAKMDQNIDEKVPHLLANISSDKPNFQRKGE